MILRFTEEELRKLSLVIGMEWQQLGTWLGFKNARIQQFRTNYQGEVANAIFEMLVEWQRQLESTCTDSLKPMAEALTKAGRADLAHKITSRIGMLY